MDSLGNLLRSNEVIHKEKNQKKNNTTNGQLDNLRGYHKPTKTPIGNHANLATDDKQIKREANYLKNIHIDATLNRLRAAGLLMVGYDAWYAGACHALGVTFVTAQADIALTKGKNPAALFHFLINKAMNSAADPFMPRVN